MKKIYILMIAVLLGGIAKGQISLIPNLSPSDSGFTDNPVVYNNNLYFQYITDSGKSHLAKYDGNNITLIPNMNTNDVGISGNAVEYNGLLYMIYINDNGKKYLAEYNGNNLSIKPNLNISDFGIEGNPFEYNGNLYFPYKNTSGKIQLAKYNGTTISLVNNLNNNDYGCIWSPMIYNNKLFFGYRDNTNHNYLANYDGSILNIIPNPDTNRYGFQNNLIIYNQSIYFNYKQYDPSNWPISSYYQLAKYDGNTISFLLSSDFGFFEPIIYETNLLLGMSNFGVKMGTHWVTSALTKWNTNDSGYVVEGTYNNYSPYHDYGYQGNSVLFNNYIYFINNTLYSSNAISKYDNFTVNNLISPNVNNINYFENPVIYNDKLFYCFEEANNKKYLAKYDGYGFEKISNPLILDNGVYGKMINFNNNLYFKYQNSLNKFQLAKYVDTITELPVVFNTTSGGNYLSCSNGSIVKLSGSQTNTKYYLYRNNILNDSLNGTANELVWSNKTAGNYTVKAKNILGISNMNGNAVINVANYVPTPATAIKGLKNVCTGMSNVVYKVDSIAHATSYIWRLPNGRRDTTLSNSISINFDTNTVATSISVRGRNCYANGDSTSLTILLNQLPGNAGVIIGADSVCKGSQYIYSVPLIANASNYIWSNSIDIWSMNSNSDSIDFYISYNSNSGYLSVKAENCMGVGDSSIKIINIIPNLGNNGEIDGENYIIQGQSGVIYKVDSVLNANSYIWDLPQGFMGQSDSNRIVVNLNNTAKSDIIRVKAANGCYSNAAIKYNVYIPDGKWFNNKLFNFDPEDVRIVKDGNNIFAGDNYDLFISRNKGKTWRSIDNFYGDKSSIEIIDSILYVAKNGNLGIFKSVDYGLNWKNYNDGIDSNYSHKLVANNGKMLASGKSILYLTSNSDTSWTTLPLPLPANKYVNPLLIDSNVFYAVVNDSILYKSIDNGIIWNQISNNLPNIEINCMLFNNNSLYLGTSQGVFVSNNQGAMWNAFNNGIQNEDITSIKAYDNKIIAGTYSGNVYLSVNNINNWYSVKSNLPDYKIYSLAVIDSMVYAGNDKGLWKRALKDFEYLQGINNALQGPTNVCAGDLVNYNINPIAGATNNYIWTFPDDASATNLNNSLSVQFNNVADSIELRVKLYGDSVFYSKFINVIDKPYISLGNEYKYFYTQNGLASNNVRDIDRDSYGNLWIATDAGVSQYVNAAFNNYFNLNVKDILLDNSNSAWMLTDYKLHKYDGSVLLFFDASNTNIAGSYYKAIAKDNQNNIWLATDMGFSKYNGSIWTNYTMPNPTNQIITGIYVDNAANVWLSLLYSGVCKFDGSNFQFYNSTNSGLLNDNINKIAWDKQNNAWFATENGLYMFDGNNWTNFNTLIWGNCKKLWIDELDNKWYFQYDYIYKFDNNEVKTYNSQGNINAIITDFYGKCWVGTQNYGLMSINFNKISGRIEVCQGQGGLQYEIEPMANANSYQWILPQGVLGNSTVNYINVDFSNTAQSGNISVIAQNNCGNSDTINFPIVVQNCTGINEINKTISNLKIYPNPANNSLTLNLSQLQALQNATVSIYDIQGKQLLYQNISQTQTQIDISSFAKGIYIIKLQTDKETLQSKFVKE